MGFSFWLKSNNGKSFDLESLQELIKDKGIADNPKLEKLFSLFDTDRNGKIDFENSKGEKELQSLFDKFYQTSGDNQILEESEVAKYLSDNNLNKDLSINDVFEFLGMFLKEDAKAENVNETETVKTIDNKEVKTKDGKVTEVKTDLGNGEFETTTYTYHNPTEKEPLEYVTLRTEKSGGSVVEFNVLGVDENGEFPEELIIDRITTTTEKGQKTRIQVFLGGERLNEVKSRANGKKIHNTYNGSSFVDLDEGKLHKITQMIKNGNFQRTAFYDGNGNTMAVIQKDDTLSNIALRYGVKVDDILKINPKIKINSLLKAGNLILVPGEFSADSKAQRAEKPIGEVMQDVNNSAFNKARTIIFSSSLKEIKLDKSYKNAYELAEKLLKDKGITPQNTKDFGTRKNDLAQEIIVANGSEPKAFQSGKKIVIADKKLDENTLTQLINAGFIPSQEYLQFYQRFHTLNQTQRQNVLNTIKVCQSRNKTNVDDIKQAVTKTFPEYYLFNEPKVENVRAVTNPEKEYMELTKNLILGMYDNAIQQFDSQRTMNPLNPMFYAEGITLAVVNPLTDLVEALYYDVCNGKKLDEKILSKIAKISPEYADKLRANPYTVIDIMASGGIRQIQNLKREASNKLNTLKPSEFKSYFKLITGQDYNPKKIEAYIQACQTQDESKISAAYDNALGTRFKNAVSDSLNWNASMSNAADIVGMLIGTGAIGKGVVYTGTELLGKETVANLGKLGRFGFSAGTNAVTMASWEVLKASAEKTTGAIIRGELPTVTDLKDVGYAGLEGAGLGVFTAAWSPITQSLMKAIDKPIQTAVAKSLQSGAKSGKDVMTTYLKMSNDPSWIAKGAGFLIETEGFVNYQMMLDAIRTFYKNGSISKDSLKDALLAMNVSENDLSSMSTAEMLEKYLCEQFKGQAQGLFEIKMISQLLMMHRGGKAVQQAMINNMIEVSSEALQNVKISKRTLHGHDFYEMEYPNGRKEIADSEKKVIANCQAFTQQYFLTKGVNDLLKAKANAEVKPETETATKPEVRTYARKSDGKVFETPKMEVKSLKLYEDILSGEKTEVAEEKIDTKSAQAKKLDFVNILSTEHTTNEQAEAILRKYGFSENDIAEIKNQYPNYAMLSEALDVVITYQEDMADKANKDEIKKFFKEYANNEEILSQLQNYTYKSVENIKNIFLGIKEDDIIEVLEELNKPDCELNSAILEKAYNIAIISGDSTLGVYRDLKYRTEEEIEKYTPERLQALKLINEAMGKDYGYAWSDIIDKPELITPEYLHELKITCDDMKQRHIDIDFDYRSNPIEELKEFKEITEKCKNFGIDFSWLGTDSNGRINTVYRESVQKILELDNPAKAQEIFGKFSEEAKKRYSSHIISLAADESTYGKEQEIVDFYNTFAKLDENVIGDFASGARDPQRFIDTMKERGIEDIKGLTLILEAFNEVGKFPSWNSFDSFEIKNGDYENAAKLIKMLPKVLNKYQLNNAISYFKNDLDYADAINKVNELEKRGLAGNLSNTAYNAIVTNKDPKVIDKYEVLYNYGYLSYDGVVKDILDDINNFSPEQIKGKLDELFNLVIEKSTGAENVDKKFIGNLYCDENYNNLYNLFFMLKDGSSIDNCGMPQLSFRDVDVKYQFYTENLNKLELNDLWKAIKNVNKVNVDYVRDLYIDEYIPNDDKLYYHICSTNESNIKIRQEMHDFLKTQEGFPAEHKIDTLNSINNQNIEFAKDIIKQKSYPPELLPVLLQYTDQKNLGFIKKYYKEVQLDDLIKYSEVITNQSEELIDKVLSQKIISVEQKVNILKNTEGNSIQDVDKYINDIYYAIKQGISIQAACAYARYGGVLENLKIRENIMKYKDILKQHDVQSDEKAIDLMLSTEESTATGHYDGGLTAVGLDGVNELLKITDMATIENATQLKFTGFKNFLLYGSLLSRLSPENHAKLKDVIAKLPYPEQKVQKIQIVTSLIGNISDAELTGLINKIETPNITIEQKAAVERIFSPENKKSYTEKVEDFLKEFNVPQTKIDNIRSWLINAKLDTKFIVPKPIEEQIKDIERKISNNERIINSGKIPEEKLEKMRASNNALKAQKEDMIANPDKYTKLQINDKAMQDVENKVRDNINYPNQTKAFIEDANKLLYAKMGIQEPPQHLLDAINYDFKYFARIFAGLDNPGWHFSEGYTFRTEFTKLVNFMIDNPNKKLTDARMSIPENQKTKAMFEENGLDFEYWNKFDENFKHEFNTIIKREQAVAEVLHNLRDELHTDLFKTFDEKERQNLLDKIKTEVDSIEKTDDIAENYLREANTILRVIETELQENEYWKENAGMFSDHIKGHHKKVREAKDTKDREITLFVRLSDSDDVGRNIFFGDHVGCCTSSGGGNGFAAAQHLQNAYVRGYEIVDKNGMSYGNSMCFFAKIDGKLTFVIDSFEANGQLASSREVPIALVKFAHEVCKREGQPDAQIMFGPNFNNIEKSRLRLSTGHSIEIVGVAPCDTYIDSMGGFGDINEPYTTNMHEFNE